MRLYNWITDGITCVVCCLTDSDWWLPDPTFMTRWELTKFYFTGRWPS